MLSYSKLGAQVFQASVNGRQLLYLSPLSKGAQHPMRGGIPVMFPQFANHGLYKKHGFARDLSWQLLEESSNGQSLVFELQIQKGDQLDWLHNARLVLTAQLLSNTLNMHLQVCNLGSTQFTWSGGLHPYICS